MSKANHLTIANLTAIFGVSNMTIHNWKKGSPTKQPLPAVDTGTREVAFKPAVIKRWAKDHGIALLVDPASLLGGAHAAAKPGPKPRARVH